ncbi:MAG: hypothetical protein AAGB93_22940 [Planctomycetota bacterium]
MDGLPEYAFHEGLSVDLLFRGARPEFGDLFSVRGFEHPDFPAKTSLFPPFADLGFDQVDDYFGIRNTSDGGRRRGVALSPLIDGNEHCHHRGPYGDARLSSCVLDHAPWQVTTALEVSGRMDSSSSCASFRARRTRTTGRLRTVRRRRRSS